MANCMEHAETIARRATRTNVRNFCLHCKLHHERRCGQAIPLFGNFSGQALRDHAGAAAARQAAQAPIGDTAAVAFTGAMQ